MFRESITIGHIFGIPVKLHFSFLLILPFLAYAFGLNIETLSDYTGISADQLQVDPFLLGFMMVVGLFISVILHELAHSLVARQKGMTIKSITLMIFGGVAEIDELTENPEEEALIAFAGPLLSLLLGVVLAGIPTLLRGLFVDLRFILLYLGQMNLFLAIFNLIPAFPTDGGRIMRSLIANRMPFLKATKISASLGKGFAFVFGILGLISGNFILLFIALFIYIAASQEYQMTLIKSTLSGLTVSDLMTDEVSTVKEEMSVEDLLQRMYRERHSGYPVVKNGRLTGCVTMEDIKKITSEEYPRRTVREIMTTEVKTVGPEEELQKALKILSREDIGRLMVTENNELVGIITRSDIIKGFHLRQLQEEIDEPYN